MTTRPDRSEAAAYYFTYVDQVPDGDLLTLLETQGQEVAELLRGIPAQQSLHRYAPGKWTIRDVVSHVIDTERLFVFRAFWFARGHEAPLPSFDQDLSAATALAEGRDWTALFDEFVALRAASVAFYRSLPEDAWARRGVASDNSVTVRALAFMTAGHVAHHVRILRERYL